MDIWGGYNRHKIFETYYALEANGALVGPKEYQAEENERAEKCSELRNISRYRFLIGLTVRVYEGTQNRRRSPLQLR